MKREIGVLMNSRGLTCAPSAEDLAAPSLQIRSNRRALVYVDRRAIGYTPQNVPVSIGSHRVSAKLPGQPYSEQVREVDVSAPVLVEFAF